MTDTRLPGRGRTRIIAALLTALALVIAGCSTAPINDTATSPPASDGTLRTGPQTARLAGSAVDPVAQNPVPTLPATAKSVGGDVMVTDIGRIIAIDRSSTLANIVYSLGLGDNVVARDRSTVIPEAENLPVVTDNGHSVNIEAVLAADPSVVLIDEATNPPGTVAQLRAAGLDVVVFTKDRTISGTGPLIRAVADALGVPREGEALAARTTQQITAAEEQIPADARGAKMAFLYLRGPRLQLLAGPGSGADELIAALGGVDAGTAAGLTSAFTTVNTEAMINANPAVILVMTQGADSVGGLEQVLKLPGLAQTDAGRNNRVVQMDQAEILAFGPDTGRVLNALSKAIYV